MTLSTHFLPEVPPPLTARSVCDVTRAYDMLYDIREIHKAILLAFIEALSTSKAWQKNCIVSSTTPCILQLIASEGHCLFP